MSDIPERYWRHTGPETRKQVAQLAKVPDDDWMQDWPLEVADLARIPEFVELFLESEDAKASFALLDLVLYSLDEATTEEQLRYWPAVANKIREAPNEYAYQLIYWACAREHQTGRYSLPETPEEQFALTPLVRPLLLELRDAIEFRELAPQNS